MIKQVCEINEMRKLEKDNNNLLKDKHTILHFLHKFKQVLPKTHIFVNYANIYVYSIM